MRRFVTLLVLLLSSVPIGVSISGCSRVPAPTFCNGGDSGIVTFEQRAFNQRGEEVASCRRAALMLKKPPP